MLLRRVAGRTIIHGMTARLLRICFLAALFYAPLCGATVRDWSKLGNAPGLSAGAEIEARTTDNKRYRGQFRRSDNEALVIATTSGEQRLARATVSRVLVKTQGHRLRNTLLGFGIGAAGGLILGTIADARCTGKCIEGNEPLGKEAGTPFGALVGIIIGVVIPTGGWREIYRAP